MPQTGRRRTAPSHFWCQSRDSHPGSGSLRSRTSPANPDRHSKSARQNCYFRPRAAAGSRNRSSSMRRRESSRAGKNEGKARYGERKTHCDGECDDARKRRALARLTIHLGLTRHPENKGCPTAKERRKLRQVRWNYLIGFQPRSAIPALPQFFYPYYPMVFTALGFPRILAADE